MFYEDLLGVKYKVHGRNKDEGFDCYGLVIECCKRNSTPLLDLWYDQTSMNCEKAEIDYINKGLNVKEYNGKPKQGIIVEMDYNGNLHAGFMVDSYNVLHTTKNGVKLTCLNGVKVKAFYEVV